MTDQLDNLPTSGTAPGEGERRAQRGYTSQYDLSAAAIYAALKRNELEWVGLADRTAGIADDLVLGFREKVIGHQFKRSNFPDRFSLKTLLMGADGLLRPLAVSWQALRCEHPGKQIEIRYVTNDNPSTIDKLIKDKCGHSAAFLADFEMNPTRSLSDWHTSLWSSLINELWDASRLEEHEFNQFLQSLRIIYGEDANFVQAHRLSVEDARLADEIALILPRLIADKRNQDHWTRAELLRELGWRDSSFIHHVHQFPVGSYVQRNTITESELGDAIQRTNSGYVSLIGPPGAGKSTLLQTSLEAAENMFLVRYLAFVPGVGQGMGRGEADDFFDDVATQLKRTGLQGLRFHDKSLHERREQFNGLLQEAGERFAREGIRTIIVIDGLDHVPREERPERSFLAELPLPASVPDGVLFVLGTQRVDLSDIKPAVQDQASAPDRMIVVVPLDRAAVHRMADLMELEQSIDRDRIFQLSNGYPLVTRYIIEALKGTTDDVREDLLAGMITFDGDIGSVYESAWRGIRDDEQARGVLDYLARAEGPIPLELLTRFLPEQAIESALTATRHLLAEGLQGWSIFHNSFRLFILNKPKLRLGKPDITYSRFIFQNLAALARSAPSNSPQRWLELRYLARAEEHESVMTLATFPRFRQQLADHRSIEELISDLRLAFASAKNIYSHLKVFQLLLIQDEIDRRWSAFKESSSFVRALLVVGDLDGAVAFVEQAPSEGYAVVDALLDVGEFPRARALFERLEPLKQLLSGTSPGNPLRISELRDWVQRVIYFRDADQILQAIRRLSNTARMQQGLEIRQEDIEELDSALRMEATLAVVRTQESVNVVEVGERFGIDSAALVALTVEAGIAAAERGFFDSALAQFQEAASQANFIKISNSRRCVAALIAARNGNLELAGTIFEGLASPSLAKLYEVSFDPDPIIRAVLEHAELVTILGRTPAAIPHFESENLRLLQFYTEKIGQYLGKARQDPLPRYVDEVANVARELLRFLSQIKPHVGGEFYEVRRIALVTPILGKALIQAAAMWGEQEFNATVAEFDRAFPDLDKIIGTLTNLRQEVAVEIYRWTGDTDAASRRLMPMVEALLESTPAGQIDELANLAICFAQVGNVTQAKELLTQLSDESLGYALPPKKDPQYVIWRDLLQHANETDPAERPSRVATLMRQVTGMMQTEGSSAAYRISAPLLKEAALCDAQTGWRVGQMLVDQGTIGWSRTVDALLFGLVKRRPDLVMTTTIVWCELSLPYYMEPHYSETNLGDFVEAAIAAASQEELVIVAERFLVAIETESQSSERESLLATLYKSSTARGVRSHALEEALLRWKAEAPPPRHASSPRRYDDVTSLLELKTKLEQDEVNGELSYEAAHAFTRLAPNSGLNLSKELFDRWDIIKQDSHARFIVVNLAIDSGRHDVAHALMEGYESVGDDLPKWTEWTGGKSLRYFKTKLRLEGSIVHKEAYDNFVGELATGREWIKSVLLETDEIFPTITETPDWVGMWDALAEQLATTREHALGSPFDKGDSASLSDEDLLVSLFTWAISLPLDELRRHSLSGALRLVETDGGRPVFKQLVQRLLAGKDDDPAVGIQLLLLESNDLTKLDLERDVLQLTDHADFAVSEPASVLAHRWGLLSPSHEAKELPSFYSSILDEDDAFEPPQLVDVASGAMLVEDPLGWTYAFKDQINLLTNSVVSAAHIRYRCRMFIDQWGGLDAFGKMATKQLEGKLRSLDMKMTFYRPHIVVAARALRYVAGELWRGGVIPDRVIPSFLYMMGYSAPQPPLIRPVSRPPFILRPTMDETNWQELEEEWLRNTQNDIYPLSTNTEIVIVEISEFQIRRSRDTFHMHRVRAPGLELDDDDRNFNGFDLLPRLYWLGQVYSPSSRPSSTIACNLSVSLIPEVPRNRLTICPHWLERLSWHSHPTNKLVFLDRENILVAQIVWWRDGGPVDIDDDVIWGQGMYLSLMPAGRQQLELLTGPLNVRVHVRRSRKPDSRDEPEKSRLAECSD